MPKKTGLVALHISRHVGRIDRKKKSELTRRAIVDAAELVVGELGYQGASISEITRRAGVALGTFYRHFESREKLFDQLLPEVGERMLEHVRIAIQGAQSAMDVERTGLEAFFDYLSRHPYFLRVLSEAQSLAPIAYEVHLKNVSRRYISSLRRSKKRGELKRLREDELETVAYMLMSAREYLASRLYRSGKRLSSSSVVQTYLKFVRAAFEGGNGGG